MPPAAPITDMHTCPIVTGVVPHVGGPVMKGEPTVIIGGVPAPTSGTLQCFVAGHTTTMIGDGGSSESCPGTQS